MSALITTPVYPTDTTQFSQLKSSQQKRNALVLLLNLKKILAQTDGRDKIIKVIQYFSKCVLWLKLLEHRPVDNDRLQALASSFSIWRKIVRLGHYLEHYEEWLDINYNFSGLSSHERMMKMLSIINCHVGIANDCVDDVVCLAKIGVLDKSWRQYEWTSSALWYTSIWLDLHACAQDIWEVERRISNIDRKVETSDSLDVTLVKERKKLADKRFMLYVNLVKLSMDGVFCTVDVFQPKDINPGWQAVSGFISGVLGCYKWWVKVA